MLNGGGRLGHLRLEQTNPGCEWLFIRWFVLDRRSGVEGMWQPSGAFQEGPAPRTNMRATWTRRRRGLNCDVLPDPAPLIPGDAYEGATPLARSR